MAQIMTRLMAHLMARRCRRSPVRSVSFLVAGFLSLAVAAVAPAQVPEARFVRADADADGDLNLTDAIFTLGFLFVGGADPSCLDSADSNDDGQLNITDPVHTLGFLFRGSPPPPPPHRTCGDDPTADELGCVEFPPCPVLSSTPVIISEFLAVNARGLRDGDRRFSDWIELTNVGERDVDLTGYYLTDDVEEKTRWAFHGGGDATLSPGDFLLVFASGQETADHVDARGNFHTNFRLDGGGEYLALVEPDGRTVVSAFAPRFPRQRQDVSYGLIRETVAPRLLVAEDHPVRWLVTPTPLPAAWTGLEYDDGTWQPGELGIGYETRERGVYRGKFETDLMGSLYNRSASVNLRVAFAVDDPAALSSLTLWMRYDDGFVAHLNGAEVARENAPAAPAANPRAAADRPDEEAVGDFAAFDLTPALPRLVAGTNVLAIQALNAAPESERFLVLPVLEAEVMGESEQYFSRPTPGEPNTPGSVGLVADTEFNVDRGLHDEAFDVAVTTSTPGATIRYTTDSSAPTATRGTLYEAPVRVEGTTVLRALAFKDGHLSTNVDTQTYLFISGPGGVLRQPNNPPGYPNRWAGFPADYEMDPEIVDHPVYRQTIESDLRSLPVMSIVTDRDSLFGTRGIYQNPRSTGRAWERPASVEFFSPDGSEEFQVDCGLRIQGGAGSRPEYPKHAFRLIFRRQYGPGKLDFDLFRGQLYGRSSVDSFDKLSLRAGFNNTFPHWYDEQALRSQYVRDQWARDLQLEMGHESTRGRYAHFYLNGMYWGIYNVGERPDEDYAASYFGGREEDYDVIKNGGARAGDARAWNRLLSLVGRDVTTPEAYAEIQESVDVVNLIDYVLENMYFGNVDWDNHNWVALRRREPPGPFIFSAWDSEFAICLPPGAQPNTWAPILRTDRTRVENSNGPTRVFQRLRGNAEFRMLLADRIQRHFFNDGVLTPRRVTEIWNRRADQVDRAIVGESARWGDYRRDVSASRDPARDFPLFTRDEHYLAHQQYILEEYFPARTDVVLGQFIRARFYPPVEPPTLEPHGGDVARGSRVRLTVAEGRAYYTLDGSDPRLPGGEVSPRAIFAGEATRSTVLATGAAVRVIVPTSGALGTSWVDPGFDDANWRRGSTGVGYDRGTGYADLISTDVGPEMDTLGSSAYIRIPFDVADLSPFDFLTLWVKYDDGFAAYLNGQLVASRNAPESPRWDSTATRSNLDSRAVNFEAVDISEHRSLLRSGANLLAIHGLNRRASDADFLIVPEITTGSAASAEIVVERTTTLKARRLSGDEWSPLTEALFEVDSGLRVAELMYH
ncbi:MAG: CotH kinase family protein, partial [Planctomycetota bacterium]|nr:CotH kinase family protein [Planctomycetota bacterium]